jgi:hypothetical protein
MHSVSKAANVDAQYWPSNPKLFTVVSDSAAETGDCDASSLAIVVGTIVSTPGARDGDELASESGKSVPSPSPHASPTVKHFKSLTQIPSGQS